MENRPFESRQSKSNLRRKALYAMAIGLMNFFGFSLLAAYVDQGWLVAAIAIPVAAGIYLVTLRCPNCGRPIFKRRGQVAGVEVDYWGGWIPKTCSGCDELLD